MVLRLIFLLLILTILILRSFFKRDMMTRGGNAVDATIASILCDGVSE